MADYSTSPNMNLPVPTISTAPGPEWASLLNACLAAIDAHDHTPDNGVPITPSGININASLPFNNQYATLVSGINFTTKGSTLSSAFTGYLYTAGGDLYYNDGTGFPVRITASGGVSGGPGSISGLTSPASAAYSSGSSTFIFQSGANIAANLDARSVILRNSGASSFGLTLSAPTLSGNYSITLPALPGSTVPMKLSSAGVITAAQLVAADYGTASIPAGSFQASAIRTSDIQAANITTALIASANITTGLIANSAITNALIAAGAVQTNSISNQQVTYAKLQLTSTSQVLIGAPVGSTTIGEITLGSGLSMSGSVLSATPSLPTGNFGDITVGAGPTMTINAGAVTASKIASGTITSTQLASNSVTSTQLASGSVTSSAIASGAVGSAQIASGAVGTSQLASGAVTSTQVAAGAIGSTQLATGAVATANIAAGAVTQAKTAARAVTSNGSDPGAGGVCSLDLGAGGTISSGTFTTLGSALTLTGTGRPTKALLTMAAASLTGGIQCQDTVTAMSFQWLINGSTVYGPVRLSSNTAAAFSTNFYNNTFEIFIPLGFTGATTYELQAKVLSGTGNITYQYSTIVVYEL